MSNLSPAPGTPQTSHKAYVSAALTFLTIFVGFWIADEDPFTKKEAAEALITALIGSGVTGVGTHVVKNRPTGARV